MSAGVFYFEPPCISHVVCWLTLVGVQCDDGPAKSGAGSEVAGDDPVERDVEHSDIITLIPRRCRLDVVDRLHGLIQTQQDRQALLKAKYCPRVAAVSGAQKNPCDLDL